MSEGGASRLLAVSAHPDDVEFTSGGSVARWVAEGWAACLVVCTDGSKGSHDPTVEPARLARRRREEQLAAARVLGVAEVVMLDHPDGELNRQAGLVAELSRLIRHFRPHRVLSWDPWHRYELHPDHRAAGLAALDAILAAGNPHYFSEHRAEGLETHQVPEVYLFGAEEPDAWVDITDTFDRKMEAIGCHASQVESISSLAVRMSHCARDYGERGGATYAEAFKLLRPFCGA